VLDYLVVLVVRSGSQSNQQLTEWAAQKLPGFGLLVDGQNKTATWW
jgi:hypothetical protein